MRFAYTVLFYLCLPFIFFRLWYRSRSFPAIRKGFGDRLGYYPFKLDHCIWIHAVSVGEVLASQPLIEALKALYPDTPLLVTTTTLTGAERVQALFKETVKHVYLPYDVPFAVKRFLKNMHPRIAIIMETELWPNLIHVCRNHHVPVCLMNARLSKRSARGYARMGVFTRPLLQSFTCIAAQSKRDAKRLITLGASRAAVTITGNIKFDLSLPDDLQEKAKKLAQDLGEDRFIWIAASTHEGEEEQILNVHQKLRSVTPNALLILVPRHPERFDSVARKCEQLFETKRRSKKSMCAPTTAVYLGDSMGELLMMYEAATVAFVGGSLVPCGGHNLLEPAILGKAILTGPFLFNFIEVSELLLSAGALLKVHDEDSLFQALMQLIQENELVKNLGDHARQVVLANRGALAKQLKLISGTL